LAGNEEANSTIKFEFDSRFTNGWFLNSGYEIIDHKNQNYETDFSINAVKYF
tara:strand:+ start:466 stop:621 length:156 start_codon:yes stop_codon:yes gene_type:complete